MAAVIILQHRGERDLLVISCREVQDRSRHEFRESGHPDGLPLHASGKFRDYAANRTLRLLASFPPGFQRWVPIPPMCKGPRTMRGRRAADPPFTLHWCGEVCTWGLHGSMEQPGSHLHGSPVPLNPDMIYIYLFGPSPSVAAYAGGSSVPTFNAVCGHQIHTCNFSITAAPNPSIPRRPHYRTT